MKLKLFAFTIIIAAALLLGAGTSVGAERLAKSLGLKVKTIYLDPWYGGRERGPLFAPKQYGKDVTLKIAQKLQALLQADGFAVHLSRRGDQLVTLEQRSVQAKSNGADIHVTIKVSQRKKDCIRISILQLEQKKSQPKPKTPKTKDLNDLNAELGEMLEALRADSAHEESLALAGKIAKKLKNGQAADCIRLLKSFDYILTNAEMPAVSVDFGVSSTASKQPYILDETSLNKITRSLVESIKEYANDRAQQATK